ncbi:MAG: type I DNA topoisomerase [bacterium]|nr:type I DNA topoisomerase [bacterium]
MKLVIVESPTKAKTIGKYLGKDYTVLSSFGHIRDLPKTKLGVDVEHDFEPQYVVPKDRTKQLAEIKAKAKKADEILFATDEDREGEAIAWHLAQALNIDSKDAKRIVFHEITEHAITEALKNPRPLDQKLVDAQQARRVLDRLVGYELSPFLWKKVARGLSAGRVQSVAVRLVVERERERKAFKEEEYWTIAAALTTEGAAFTAQLITFDDTKLEKFSIANQARATEVVDALTPLPYTVSSISEKAATRRPPPPFTTSTLQQAANQRLGYSAAQTMRLAQQLYEGIPIGSEGHVGLITYMRTDSMNMAVKFRAEAKQWITKKFGANYAQEHVYKTKSKGAQEAHEAIRPTDPSRAPEFMRTHLTPQQHKLYTLIWQRAVATQMSDAKLKETAIDIAAGTRGVFRATGTIVAFPGFLSVLGVPPKDVILPDLHEKDALTLTELTPEQHFTKPPARYSDATLVKALEEHGIGRPSTYAPTIATIIARKYVDRDDEKRLAPTAIAELVTDLLIKHFSSIVDLAFTAKMEEDLDRIAEGETPWVPIIKSFWTPFKENLDKKSTEVSKKEITEEATDRVCPECAKPMIIKMGRFGKFLACTGFPDCRHTEQIGDDGEPKKTVPLEEKCPQCGGNLEEKRGRFGPFIGCSGYPTCKYIKKEEQKLGIACPQCGKGELVGKRTRRRKPFYGCNRYPDCDFALWQKPTGEKCPKCGSLMVEGKKGTMCSKKECE